MKSLKRKMAMMFVVVFMLTQMPLHVLADVIVGNNTILAAQLDEQARTITVNFPGVEGVQVRYSTNTAGWQTVASDIDDGSYTFVLPAEHLPTSGSFTVQVHAGASLSMTYRFYPVLEEGIPTVLNVPMRNITVSGINAPSFAPVTVHIVQGGWVHQMPVQGNNAANPFILFDNGRPYEIRIGVAGYHYITGRMTPDSGNYNAWFGGLFSQHLVPAGVTNVRISNANWVDTTITHSFGMGGDVITLFNNQTQAWLTFDYDGRTFTRIPFYLDGTNPWNDMTIVRFDGMEDVRIQTNIGPHNAWVDEPGTTNNYRVLSGLAPNTRIRGVVGANDNYRSLEVIGGGGFNVVHLLVSEVVVTGIGMPGLNIDVRRSDNNYLTSGLLVARHQPHPGGELRFNTFTTEAGASQMFMVRLTGFAFSPLERFFANYFIDLSDYFYEVTIPDGVTGVTIRTAFDPNGPVVGGVNNLDSGTFTLMATQQAAYLRFTFDGIQYTLPIVLDGTNPFDRIVILRFPGATGITNINTQMVGHGWTNRDNLNVNNGFAFINTKWVTPQNTDLLFIQLQAPGLGFSMHHPTGGVPVFTVIDIPITTITVINDLGCNVHVSTQQTGAPGQNAPGRNGIWFEGGSASGEKHGIAYGSELVFWVFDYGLHWVRAGAPVNSHPFVTLDGIAPGATVYISQFFACEICGLCPICDECCPAAPTMTLYVIEEEDEIWDEVAEVSDYS